MVELGFPTPVQGGDDPALAPIDTQGGKSLLGANPQGQTKRLLVDNSSSLLVHVTEDDSITDGSPINVYGEVVAPFNTETNIISYTVPSGMTLKVTTIEMWGDYFGEYFVRINGTQVGGTNIGCAARSKTLELKKGPIVANAGNVLTISIQHQAMGNVKFHSNLMGGLS